MYTGLIPLFLRASHVLIVVEKERSRARPDNIQRPRVLRYKEAGICRLLSTLQGIRLHHPLRSAANVQQKDCTSVAGWQIAQRCAARGHSEDDCSQGTMTKPDSKAVNYACVTHLPTGTDKMQEPDPFFLCLIQSISSDANPAIVKVVIESAGAVERGWDSAID